MSLPPLLPRLSHALQRIATGPARTIASPPTQPRRASVALLVRIRPHPDDEARLAEEYDASGMPLAASPSAGAEKEMGEGGTQQQQVTNAPPVASASPSASQGALGESFTSSLAPDSTAQLGGSSGELLASSSSDNLGSRSLSPSNSGSGSASASASASATASLSVSNATPPASSTLHSLSSFFSLPWVSRGTPEVLYIKRSSRIGDKWSSHVALPGGRREESDENGLYTAMRETWEEVGLDLAEREFLEVGQLDDREITTSLGKRLLMVLSPYVFLQTSPFSPLPELQPSEVASAHWIPLSLLYTPTPKWGLTSVDIASRLAPKSPLVRAALRALVGKMDFKCVLLPNAPVATAELEGEGEEEFGRGERRKEKATLLEEGERPELRLWGLTLGITLDLLANMSTFPPSGLRTHHSFTPEGIPAASHISPSPPASSSSSSPTPPSTSSPSAPPSAPPSSSPLARLRSAFSALRAELHLSPPPHADALAPSMTSVFPRFSYADINAFIWLFGWRYRAVIRGWERALASGGRGERERNWSGLALGAFYSAVRRALVVAILLRALGFASFAGILTWLGARRVRRARRGLPGLGLEEIFGA